MRFVSVRQIRPSPSDLWKNLQEDQEIILTSNGKPEAISSLAEVLITGTTGFST